MSSSGGTPSALSAADGTMPKSLTLVELGGKERIFFTGVDPDDETIPAVMSMSADGSDFEVVLRGEPLVDPSGIAVTKSGTIYVADSNADALGNAAIVTIVDGEASLLASDLRVGFPAGIALDFEETALFVSGLSKEASSSLVYHIGLDSKEITTIDDGISHNSESAGVHRAHKADVFAWANADGSNEEPAGGTVYLLKGPGAN
jgi:sugar lactone lactonase YvrE